MGRALFKLITSVIALSTVLALAEPVHAAVHSAGRGNAHAVGLLRQDAAMNNLPDYTGTLYPSGCHTFGYGSQPPTGDPGSDWQPNCWVGNGYITGAVYVAGIQRIDGDYGCNNGGLDGLYGPNTEAGVKCFQAFFAQTEDGIVGPDTWYFEGATLYYSGSGTNYWIYSVLDDDNRFLKGDYDDNGKFGPYTLKCGETGLLFSDDNYPNPKVPCV